MKADESGWFSFCWYTYIYFFVTCVSSTLVASTAISFAACKCSDKIQMNTGKSFMKYHHLIMFLPGFDALSTNFLEWNTFGVIFFSALVVFWFDVFHFITSLVHFSWSAVGVVVLCYIHSSFVHCSTSENIPAGIWCSFSFFF